MPRLVQPWPMERNMTVLRKAAFTLSVLAAGAIASVTPVQATDSTIPCSAPPDKGASVAVRSGTQVSKTQDRTNGTCTFSINGAVATSPPAQQVLNALNLFRDPSRSFLRQPGTVANALAALMAAGAPVNEVPRELSAIIERATSQLNSCMLPFFDGKPVASQSSEDGRVSCTAYPPYADPASKAAMLSRNGLAVGVPTLAISVRWGGDRFVSVVYLPITMVGMPPLRLQ